MGGHRKRSQWILTRDYTKSKNKHTSKKYKKEVRSMLCWEEQPNESDSIENKVARIIVREMF